DSTFAFLAAMEANGMGHLYTTDIQGLDDIDKDARNFGWVDRLTRVVSDSVAYAQNFKLDSIDILYIDTNHEYDHTLRELEAWFPLVKQGGHILLDDFLTTDVHRALFDWIKKSDSYPFTSLTIYTGPPYTNAVHTLGVLVLVKASTETPSFEDAPSEEMGDGTWRNNQDAHGRRWAVGCLC